MKDNSIPWVEKYRPTCFENIVLDENKREIFNNIIKKKLYFPNLIFFGPPGTGKTTTIINIINAFHKENNKPLIIHLNASDERGIDIIRTNIMQFVFSAGLFQSGIKFIILDEIDYMTKSAQLALKYLIEHTTAFNVRYCLICNYISKVEASLSENFIMFRFNAHPLDEVKKFIQHIISNELLYISDECITRIIQRYKSDLRSMINYIQLNRLDIDLRYFDVKYIRSELKKNKHKSNKHKLQFFKNISEREKKQNTDLLKELIMDMFNDFKNEKQLNKENLRHFSNIYHNIKMEQDVLILYAYDNLF